MEFYVYFLIDPLDNSIFYVGKGKSNRMKKHENWVRKKGEDLTNNKYKFDRIKKIIDRGLSVITKKVFESDYEGECYTYEKKIIEEIGIDNLCNIFSPLDIKGVSQRSKEGLLKSEKNKKRLEYIKTHEYKENCRKRNLGENNPCFGKKWNENQENKIKEANRKPKSEEHKKKISNSLKKYTKTEEHRKKISESLKNSENLKKSQDDVYRDKIRKKTIGSLNPNSKTYIFLNEVDGIFEVKGFLRMFLKEKNITYYKFEKMKKERDFKFNGWTLLEFEK